MIVKPNIPENSTSVPEADLLLSLLVFSMMAVGRIIKEKCKHYLTEHTPALIISACQES